jgi:hypothetical protein
MVFAGYAREAQMERAELAGLLLRIRPSHAEGFSCFVSCGRRSGALSNDSIQQGHAAFGRIKAGKESQRRGQYSLGRRMTLSVK